METGRDEKGRFTEKNIWAYADKHVGRPPIYETEQELWDKAKEYFEYCQEVRKGKFTEAGLRLWLGFTKKNWHDYKYRPNFVTIIDLIEAMFEDDAEQRLMWAGSAQGAIFKLKNKHGWKDEVTQHQTHQSVNVDFGNTLQSTSESKKDS